MNPTSMNPTSITPPTKSIFKSMTYQGLAIIFLPTILKQFGIDLTSDQLTGAVDVVSNAITSLSPVIGAIMVGVGRARAKTGISLFGDQ